MKEVLLWQRITTRTMKIMQQQETMSRIILLRTHPEMLIATVLKTAQLRTQMKEMRLKETLLKIADNLSDVYDTAEERSAAVFL